MPAMIFIPMERSISVWPLYNKKIPFVGVGGGGGVERCGGMPLPAGIDFVFKFKSTNDERSTTNGIYKIRRNNDSYFKSKRSFRSQTG
jgi:hypothetical protein